MTNTEEEGNMRPGINIRWREGLTDAKDLSGWVTYDDERRIL